VNRPGFLYHSELEILAALKRPAFLYQSELEISTIQQRQSASASILKKIGAPLQSGHKD
jgi:hypothetical protein